MKIVTEARILQQLERTNVVLERIAHALENLVPPLPVDNITPDEPETVIDEYQEPVSNESKDLEELETL